VVAVMIGIDPRKASHTSVAINAAEEPLGQLRARACVAQVERLLAWAQAPAAAAAVASAAAPANRVSPSRQWHPRQRRPAAAAENYLACQMARRAWVGEMRAARMAGSSPARAPMITAAARPPAQAWGGMTTVWPWPRA
jgi:hypothetical protein